MILNSRLYSCLSFRVGLGPDETASVTASFTVPLGTLVGTADGIVVTVTSQLDGTQNYARTTLVVISDVRNSFF